MHYLIFGLWVLIYLGGIVAISLKLRDIVKNPAKYEEEELEDEACRRNAKAKTVFFKSLSHRYNCLIGIPFFIVFPVVGWLVIQGCHALLLGNNAGLAADMSLIGVLAAEFLGIGFMGVIPFHIRKPLFAVMTLDLFNGDRQKRWKKAYIMILIMFILTVPFIGLSCTHYAGYNDSGITTSGYFQVGETYTAYADVTEAKVELHRNKHDQPTQVSYEVRLSDGTFWDINSPDTCSKSTLTIHERLLAAGCHVTFETALTESDLAYLREKYSAAAVERTVALFEGAEENSP
jgi:hypothetical protein